MIDARQTNGRFAKGNSGGPGRPRRRVEADYLAALCDAVPPDAWQAIVRRAVADAKEGDAKARDWLSRYLLGNATTLTELASAPALDPALSPDEVAAERRAKLEAIRDRLMAGGANGGGVNGSGG